MLVLRLIGILLVISVGACFVAYVVTRNARYLSLAGSIIKYAGIGALLIIALLVLERVLVL